MSSQAAKCEIVPAIHIMKTNKYKITARLEFFLRLFTHRQFAEHALSFSAAACSKNTNTWNPHRSLTVTIGHDVPCLIKGLHH